MQAEIAKLRAVRTPRAATSSASSRTTPIWSPRSPPRSRMCARHSSQARRSCRSISAAVRLSLGGAKDGPVAFAIVQGGTKSFDEKVKKLRAALDPQAQSISEIPPFDVDLAHQLYNELLKPVENGWKDAKDMILVTNGALGLLPLGLLPTEPPSRCCRRRRLLFGGYRKVPWLARTHAVTMVPSAAALRTLARPQARLAQA